MEFRRGTLEYRQDRRICASCELKTNDPTCSQCGKESRPRIRISWYIHGQRQRELTLTWRPQDAAQVLRRKEEDYWRQQELGVTREIGGTLQEGFAAFLMQQATSSDDNKKQIATAIKALANGVGWDRPLPLITGDDIAQYKQDGLTTLAPTSVRSYMLVLRRFFKYLRQEGWIRLEPTARVKLPKARARRDCLRPHEVGPVLDLFWQMAPQIAPIATTFVLGGWRKGEIVNLRRADVEMEKRWAYVLDFEGDELTEEWQTKTDHSLRAVPLHPLVVRALQRVEPVMCPDGRVSPWVFPIIDARRRRRLTDKRGRSLPVCGDRRSPATAFFGTKLHKVMAAAGIERRVTIHGLRRTFAVLLQEAGAPDAVIQQALGHRPQGVTATHYLPRRDPLIQKYVDLIEVDIPALDGPAPIATTDPPIATNIAPRNRPSQLVRSDSSVMAPPLCPPAAPRTPKTKPPYLRLVK